MARISYIDVNIVKNRIPFSFKRLLVFSMVIILVFIILRAINIFTNYSNFIFLLIISLFFVYDYISKKNMKKVIGVLKIYSQEIEISYRNKESKKFSKEQIIGLKVSLNDGNNDFPPSDYTVSGISNYIVVDTIEGQYDIRVNIKDNRYIYHYETFLKEYWSDVDLCFS